MAGVGTATGPARLTTDPLKNATWNNAALIASGSFAGPGIPAFESAGLGPAGNRTDANVLTNLTLGQAGNAVKATVSTVVRSDAVAVGAGPGLKRGDANRDFAVTIADFGILNTNFNTTGKTWDQGDFNDDGAVTIADFGFINTNFNTTSPSPVSAVPEPATVGLALAAAIACFGCRRMKA